MCVCRYEQFGVCDGPDTMNFRQRIAWLFVAFYLACTCAIVYYIFEISDTYNTFALEHVEQFHGGGVHKQREGQQDSGFLHHIIDVPLIVWVILMVLPYLQVFCMLLACTKPQPQFSYAFLWPIYVALRTRSFYMRCAHPPVKAINSLATNGHIVIDT